MKKIHMKKQFYKSKKPPQKSNATEPIPFNPWAYLYVDDYHVSVGQVIVNEATAVYASSPNPEQPQKLTTKEISNDDYMEGIEKQIYVSINTAASYSGKSAKSILAAAKTGSFPSSFQFDDDEVWLSADIAYWLEALPLSPSNLSEGGVA